MDTAQVDERGPRGDRRWMVTTPDGRFVSQREHPRMCLVKTELTADTIRLTAPGMAPLVLPRVFDGERRQVTVWRSTVPAAIHAEGGLWLSDFLGVGCRLVHMPPDVHRSLNPERARPSDRVGFADGYPFLLTSQASLDALNQRLDAPVSMARFRPNIVLTGCEPFAEDQLQRLQIGALRFRGPKLCERCSIPAVDPQTGARSGGGEPLRSLAALHTVRGRICFGINLIHDGPGTLRVGDRAAPIPG